MMWNLCDWYYIRWKRERCKSNSSTSVQDVPTWKHDTTDLNKNISEHPCKPIQTHSRGSGLVLLPFVWTENELKLCDNAAGWYYLRHFCTFSCSIHWTRMCAFVSHNFFKDGMNTCSDYMYIIQKFSVSNICFEKLILSFSARIHEKFH